MLKSQAIDISVIIPAKDEEKRLPVFLEELIFYCQNSKKKYEIIIVDDGSQDQTTQVALKFRDKFASIKVIQLRENRGKGNAIRTGFFEAKGEIVLFTDADGSTPPTEIENNLHYFDQGYQVVIGSRVLLNQKCYVKAKVYRKRIGQIFNFFVHLFLMKDIQDTQCGFKMFHRRTIQPLFSRLNINGFGFDLEILYLAYQLGYKVKETPVNWHHVDDSKTDLLRDSWRMFFNIFQVRRWHGIEINQDQEHMSPEEIHLMEKNERIHWWFRSRSQFLKQLIRKQGRSYTQILDAGCGTGLNLEFLQDFGNSIGCDAQKEAVELCFQKGFESTTRCKLDQVPFKTDQFDLVTLFDVIEHVPEPHKALLEMRRVLKSQGQCIITVPAFKFLWSAHDEAVSHLRRYALKEAVQTLEDAGFDVKEKGYYFSLLFLPVACIRVLKRALRIKNKGQSDTASVPPNWINQCLMGIMRLELKLNALVKLPFGTSIYVVAQPGVTQNQLIDGYSFDTKNIESNTGFVHFG